MCSCPLEVTSLPHPPALHLKCPSTQWEHVCSIQTSDHISMTQEAEFFWPGEGRVCWDLGWGCAYSQWVMEAQHDSMISMGLAEGALGLWTHAHR